MPAPASLRKLSPQTPFYAPAHAATFSPGAVTSGAARQGRGRDALLAAARTVRAKSARARPQTIRAATPSPSRVGRDARPRGSFPFGLLVGRTSPSCHAVRSPDRNCSSVEAEGPPLRQRPAGRRVQPAPAELHGSFSAIEPGPVWHTWPMPGGRRPRCSAHRPAIADRASQGDDIFC